MREKIKNNKKLIIFSSSLVVVIGVLLIGFKFYNNTNNKLNNKKEETQNDYIVQDKELNIKEDKGEESIVEEEQNQTDNTPKNIEDNNINSKSSTNNKSNNTQKNSTPNNNNVNSTTDNNSNVENNSTVPTQSPVEETSPKVNEESKPQNYVGVPDPNSFFYSIHKGRIDKNYTTLEACRQKSVDVGFLDTTDILNIMCYEVLDGQSNVLGIYMHVNCISGNCERYKVLASIETS